MVLNLDDRQGVLLFNRLVALILELFSLLMGLLIWDFKGRGLPKVEVSYFKDLIILFVMRNGKGLLLPQWFIIFLN